MQLCSPACQYLSRYIKRTARDRPGTSSQKKRRTKRREEKWEATAVTALLKATQTPRTRAVPLAARYSPAIFYGENIVFDRPTAGASSLQVLTSSTTSFHRDSLKDIPDDRLSGRANNGGDTRARMARGRRGRGKRKRSRSPSSAWNA